jgi:outer membrane protein TolC
MKIKFFLGLLSLIMILTRGNSYASMNDQVLSMQQYGEMILKKKGLDQQWDQEKKILDLQHKQIWQKQLPQLSLEQEWSQSQTEISLREVKKHQAGMALKSSWTLFQGGQEFSQWDMISLQKEQLTWKEKEERRLIMEKIIDQYFQYWILQKDHEIMEEFLSMSEERIQWLRERIRLGRSRKSELPAAQAQRELWRSQLQSMKTQLKSLQQQMSIYLDDSLSEHWRPQSFSQRGWEQWERELKRTKMKDEDLLLSRSDHQLWILDEALKKKEREKAWRAHYPDIQLSHRYFLYKSQMKNSHDWDVAFTISFPLFSGGTTQTVVSEKELEQSLSSLQRKEKEDDQKVSLRNLQGQIETLTQQNQLLQKATDLAKENYELQKQDAQQGLVQQSEVLNALNSFLDLKRQREKARISYFEQLVLKELFLGELQIDSLPKDSL